MDTDEEWNRAAQIDDFVPAAGVISGDIPADQGSSSIDTDGKRPAETSIEECVLRERYTGSNRFREDSRDGNGCDRG